MKDIPIIFSTPMVRALLDGRKTQTRRLAWRTLEPLPKGQIDVREETPTPWQHVQPGDRLWVREAWAPHPGGVMRHGAVYRAEPGAVPDAGRWRPSIHMPRWASRITLHVEAVRVEKLQAISAADALAEGLALCAQPQEAFRDLWNSLHGPDAWASNPEVVALTFTVAHRNIDAEPGA